MFMQNAGFNNSYGVLIDWVAYLGEHNSRLPVPLAKYG